MKYYAVSVEKESTRGDYGNSNYDALYKSHGPTKNQTLIGAIDECSRIAEKIGKPVHLYYAHAKTRVPKHPMERRDLSPYLSQCNYKFINCDEDLPSRSYSTTTDEFLEFLRAHDIQLIVRVCGNPKHDDDLGSQVMELQRQFADDDKEETRFLHGVSGATRWSYLKKWDGMTPEQIFRDIHDETPGHGAPDLEALCTGFEWTTRDSVSGVLTGPLAKAVRIDVSRYGYSVHVVYGQASPEEERLNRLATAACGLGTFDQEDADAVRETHGEGPLLIAREWKRGLTNG